MTLYNNLENSPLGKNNILSNNYDKSLLFSIAREEKRREIGLGPQLPFQGTDIWNLYELSWLNSRGKPVVAMATIIVPAESPRIFESKSLKLYLNALHSTHFASEKELNKVIAADLTEAVEAPVIVTIQTLEHSELNKIAKPKGVNLDHYDIATNCYTYNPNLLSTSDHLCSEILYSNLLKSNCPITNQPDWATLLIQYEGHQINHDGLLKYIISMRDHNEFHEHCVEQIFLDISLRCKPEKLLVYARYTRRGGIDINPQRASHGFDLQDNIRLFRQ